MYFSRIALAALLLLDDGGGPAANVLDTAAEVPDGSTVMDVPVPGQPGQPQPAKKAVSPTANTSAAAAEILKKYQRRPRS